MVNEGSNANANSQSQDKTCEIIEKLNEISIAQGSSSSTTASKKNDSVKREHKFWDTQPVSKLDSQIGSSLASGKRNGNGDEDEGSDTAMPFEEGAIEPDVERMSVRAEPYSLHELFEWSAIDLNDEAQLREVYTLLTLNYVEDTDAMFRFDYSAEFIRWALQPPNYVSDWHVGVRAVDSKKLVAFISGVPMHLRMRDSTKSVAEINFLCIHKKLRLKRLAPLLIREITRRVNQTGRFQAVYTAGIVLPRPVATCRYWHRSLDPKKLVEARFSSLQRNWTLSRTIKQYALPQETTTLHIRAMEKKDAKAVMNLLNKFLETNAILHPHFTLTEVTHYLLPLQNVVYSYVAQDPKSGVVTDFVSFYNLPSTIVDKTNPHKEIRAAYLFYYAVRTDGSQSVQERLRVLLTDALILAVKEKFDVFNCLNLLQNSEELLQDLKFGIGDGQLRYYLFNWRMRDIEAKDVGLVML